MVTTIPREDRKGETLIGTPHPGAGLEEMLAAQREDARRNDPEVPLAPFPLPEPAPNTWRFRTKPGRRMTSIPLRVPPEYSDRERTVREKNQFEKALRDALRNRGIETKAEQDAIMKADQKFYEHFGNRFIKFKPIPRRMEAVFETDDPKVAAYIRDRLPEFNGVIYEEIGPMVAEINGVKVRVLPADDEARLLMGRAAAGG